VCSVKDTQEGSLKRFLVEGEEILVVRLKGEYYALEERCTHRGGPLSEGSLEGGYITCPWHFGQFVIATGEVASPPPTLSLKTRKVKIENGSVFVSRVRDGSI
jgi:3-phenylpropionate/trans-cinnamate dioxygenase ferredoxin component